MDNQESIPPPSNPWTDQSSKESSPLFKIWCSMGLQQCTNQRRGWMKSSICHEPRPLRTTSYVLRANELPGNLSNHDEWNLRNGTKGRVALNLYGWHLSKHKPRLRQTSKMRPSCSDKTKGTQFVHETRKVPIWTGSGRISGGNPQGWHHINGFSKGKRSGRLATPAKCQRHASLPRIHRILLILHPQLLQDSKAPHRPNQKGHPISLGTTTGESVWNTKEHHVQQAHPKTTRL